MREEALWEPTLAFSFIMQMKEVKLGQAGIANHNPARGHFLGHNGAMRRDFPRCLFWNFLSNHGVSDAVPL